MIKITAEIIVEFEGEEPEITDLDEGELTDAITSAVSDCDGIVRAGSVSVQNLTVRKAG